MSFISTSSSSEDDFNHTLFRRRALSLIESFLSDLASSVFEPEFFEQAKLAKLSVLDVLSKADIEEGFVLENLDLRLKDFYLIVSAESDYKMASLIHKFYSNFINTYPLYNTSLSWFCNMITARSLYWVNRSFYLQSSKL